MQWKMAEMTDFMVPGLSGIENVTSTLARPYRQPQLKEFEMSRISLRLSLCLIVFFFLSRR